MPISSAGWPIRTTVPCQSFLHRQGVQVGAEQYGRADAVGKHADYAVSANMDGDGASSLAEFFTHAQAGLFLMQGQLRMGMQMLVELG